MGTPSRIMLDPLHVVLAVLEAVEIHDTDSALVSTATMADSDMTCEITATTGLALFWEGQLEDGSTFVQMVVYRANKMTNTRCSGLVAAESGLAGHGGVAHGRWFDVLLERIDVVIWGGSGSGDGRGDGSCLDDGSIVTGDER
jgi:hypothetical protein